MSTLEAWQNDGTPREMLAMCWQEHGDAVRRYCTTRLGSPLGEDVAQDVFLTAWGRWSDCRKDQPLRPWLFGIARRKCLHAWRDHHRRQALEQEKGGDIQTATHTPEPIPLESWVTHKVQQQRLSQQIARLSAEDRLLLGWWYWQECSLRDLSALLGTSIPVVRKRLARAHRRIQQRMLTTDDTPMSSKRLRHMAGLTTLASV